MLRTIRGGGERVFVPSLAVAFGLLLALVSIGMLIFFIHYIASSIQAANVIGGAAQETEKTFDKLFPKEQGDNATPAERAGLADLEPLRWVPSAARESGYIQGIDEEELLAFAHTTNAVVRMRWRWRRKISWPATKSGRFGSGIRSCGGICLLDSTEITNCYAERSEA